MVALQLIVTLVLSLWSAVAAADLELATEEDQLKGLPGELTQIDAEVLEQQLAHVRPAKGMGLAAGPLDPDGVDAHLASCAAGLQRAVDSDALARKLPERPVFCFPADSLLHNPAVKLLEAAGAEGTELAVLAVDGCTGLGWKDGHARYIDETPAPTAAVPKPKKVKSIGNATLKVQVALAQARSSLLCGTSCLTTRRARHRRGTARWMRWFS